MAFDTSHFIKKRIEVKDPDMEMVFGRAKVHTPAPAVSRLVILGVAQDEVHALASLVAEELDMTVHFMQDASEATLAQMCALEQVVIVPTIDAALADGVLPALQASAKVFFCMVNPVRIASVQGLSGDEGEAFCRQAIAFEDACLGMSHMMLPDGNTPQELVANVLNCLGHVRR